MVLSHSRIKMMLLGGALSVIGSAVVFAQSGGVVLENSQKNVPIVITADKTLEWHRNDRQYIARGDVEAKQGSTAIYGDVVTADYRDEEEGSVDLWRMTAAKDVRVVANQATAYGQTLVYDIDKSVAVMKGSGLKMVTPQHVVTAEESFEYWVDQGILKAIGQAVAVSGDDRLEGEVLTAIFEENAEGKRVLKRLTAKKNVRVTTPTEILIGDEGFYDAVTQKAVVEGNVKIVREKNVLEGVRAEVDLKTNISKMYGGGGAITPATVNGRVSKPVDKQRVRGVFYPSAQKDK